MQEEEQKLILGFAIAILVMILLLLVLVFYENNQAMNSSSYTLNVTTQSLNQDVQSKEGFVSI